VKSDFKLDNQVLREFYKAKNEAVINVAADSEPIEHSGQIDSVSKKPPMTVGAYKLRKRLGSL
jgi:hypothetical protein